MVDVSAKPDTEREAIARGTVRMKPETLAMIQAGGTLSACVGLCGLAVGLGARIPSYREANTGRIASGLGGTVNLMASIGLVSATVALMGLICSHMAGTETLHRLDRTVMLLFAGQIVLGIGVAVAAMRIGVRSFKTAEF